MKHLRDFRIFESDDKDDDSVVPTTGFDYSFNDIKDTLWDILDLGFKITKRQYDLWSEELERHQKLSYAKWAVWELTLEADVDCETIVKYQSTRYGSGDKRILLNDSNLELDVLQSIADMRTRFQKVYHHLELKGDYGDNGWLLHITVMSDIDSEEISKAKVQEKDSEIKSTISTQVSNFFRRIRKIGTNKFQTLSSKNKLGESSWSGLGKVSEGYICIFINTTQMTKQVKSKSFEELQDSIDTIKNWYFPIGTIVELRKITKEDCKKLSELHNTTIQQMEERYLDLDAVFVKYDYKKWYTQVSKE